MTEFTTWRSLVDGEEISATPDSGGTHQWDYVEGSGTLVEDQIGTLDADFTDITWKVDAGAGGFYGELNGEDDYADLGNDSRSSFSHWVNDGEGTLFAWVNPNSFPSDDFAFYYGSELTSQKRTVTWGIDGRDGEEHFLSIGNGNGRTKVAGADIGFGTDEWTAVAAVGDGSEMYVYEAVGPDYDIVERDSEPVDDTASGDLEENVIIGAEEDGSQRHWHGGLDLMFTDSEGWSESELQDFVDDSKHFYE